MKFINLFVFFVVIISCQNEDNKKVDLDNSNIINFGKYQFEMLPISKKEFDLFYKKSIEKSENHYLKKDSFVNKKGDSIIFELKNSEYFYLKNETKDEGNYVVYEFKGSIKNLPFWQVEASFYEWFEYILINKLNGDTTMMFNHPIISPNNKIWFTPSADLERLNWNGIEIHELENNKLKKIGEIELSDWGPNKAYWKDNKTIYLEQLKWSKSNDYLKTYCKLILK